MATRVPQCRTCYDLAICYWEGSSSRSKDVRQGKVKESCPHSVEIPLRQLQDSARNSTCQICHVFFGALRPYITDADPDALENAAVVAEEGLKYIGNCTIILIDRGGGTRSSTRVLDYDYNDQNKILDQRLYGAELFVQDKFHLQSSTIST